MSLSERAMLVDFSISAWGGSKRDKTITRDVIDRNGASHDAGSFTKNLIGDRLKKLSANNHAFREFVKENTVAWPDHGLRALSTARFITFQDGYNERKEKTDALIDEFLSEYPSLRAVHDTRRMGGMYDESDYPSERAIRSKFGVTIRYYPMPDSSDFERLLLGGTLTEIQQQWHDMEQHAAQSAMRDILDRFAKESDNDSDIGKIRKLSNRLREYGQTKDKRAGRFSDSIIGNITALCDAIPEINPYSIPALDDLIQRIRVDICSIHPETLRNDEQARITVATRTDKILADIDSMLV